MQENYDCDVGSCPAGYDGLHPNALGTNIYILIPLLMSFPLEKMKL